MSRQHLAAILSSKGSGLEVVHRPTPSPGPHELLIEVKSIALNSIDWKQRDSGSAIAGYPAIIGSDIGGIVVSGGSSVGYNAPKPGTRVTAFAPCFFTHGSPDYGAFQTHVLVPVHFVAPIPQRISFNEASVLPMAVLTSWCGFTCIDIARDSAYTAADKTGILIWGGSASIGTAAIQLAKSMGFTVYATASKKHHEYLKSLGASKLFDYKNKDVAESIVQAAKSDGITVQVAFDAVGQAKDCIEILKELKGEGTAKVASAIPFSKEEDAPIVDGVELKFISAPKSEKERTELAHFVFGTWLREKLEAREFVPSPRIQVVGRSLGALTVGLNELKRGVSGMKLVVEVKSGG